MLRRNLWLGVRVFALIALVGLQLNVHAGPGGGGKKGRSGVPMTLQIYTTIVDEQDLNAYYGTTFSCPGSAAPIDNAELTGDFPLALSTAYDFAGSPWTPVSGLDSSSYAHGSDCQPNDTSICTKVEMGTNLRTVNADIRGTAGPRTVTLDFGRSCTTCSIPGNPTYFGTTTVTTEMHVTFFLDIPYTDMAVCSSTACPEAQAAWARLWFPDPMGDPLLEYRVDWGFLRVLRMNATTWYFLADGCDGTQLAHLYRLHNQQKKPSIRFQGSYLIPFFVSGVQQ